MFRLRAQGDRLDPPVPGRAGLPRGGDADPAAALRRRGGAAVRDAPQRARHAALPPHRGRAVPQAAARGRARAGLRDRPRLPERGNGPDPQSRVHDARVVPGLRRLHRHDGADGGHRLGRDATHCLGTRTIERAGVTLDFTPPFRARAASSTGSASAAGSISARRRKRRCASAAAARASRPSRCRDLGGGKLQDEVFKVVLEPHLVQPTFVLDYPKPLSPLAKEHRADPALTERFELFVDGPRAGQRVQRAQRPRRPAAPLRGPGAAARRRR